MCVHYTVYNTFVYYIYHIYSVRYNNVIIMQ